MIELFKINISTKHGDKIIPYYKDGKSMKYIIEVAGSWAVGSCNSDYFDEFEVAQGDLNYWNTARKEKFIRCIFTDMEKRLNEL